MHNNNFLLSLSRLVQNRFYAIGSLYGSLLQQYRFQLVVLSRPFRLGLLRLFENFNIIV